MYTVAYTCTWWLNVLYMTGKSCNPQSRWFSQVMSCYLYSPVSQDKKSCKEHKTHTEMQLLYQNYLNKNKNEYTLKEAHAIKDMLSLNICVLLFQALPDSPQRHMLTQTPCVLHFSFSMTVRVITIWRLYLLACSMAYKHGWNGLNTHTHSPDLSFALRYGSVCHCVY